MGGSWSARAWTGTAPEQRQRYLLVLRQQQYRADRQGPRWHPDQRSLLGLLRCPFRRRVHHHRYRHLARHGAQLSQSRRSIRQPRRHQRLPARATTERRSVPGNVEQPARPADTRSAPAGRFQGRRLAESPVVAAARAGRFWIRVDSHRPIPATLRYLRTRSAPALRRQLTLQNRSELARLPRQERQRHRCADDTGTLAPSGSSSPTTPSW